MNPFTKKKSTMSVRQFKYRYGSSVAVTDDGLMMAVGSPEDNAVVLMTSQGFQNFEPILGKNLPNHSQIGFGASVAMSEDGEIIVVGIPTIQKYTGSGTEEDPWGPGVITGGFQVWKRESSGITWGSAEHIELFEDLPHGAGNVVALTPDASILAVACPDEEDDTQCKVYVYYREFEQFWPMTGSPLTGDGIGRSLAISNDGTFVVIATGTTQETVKTFVLNPTTHEFLTWESRHNQTVGSSSTGMSGTGYGASVSLSSDGNTLVVGEDISNVIRTFRYSMGVWSSDHIDVSGKGWSAKVSADGLYLASVSETDPSKHTAELVVHKKTNASDTEWTLFSSIELEGTRTASEDILDDTYEIAFARLGAPETKYAVTVGVPARKHSYSYLLKESDTSMGSNTGLTMFPDRTPLNSDTEEEAVAFSGMHIVYWSPAND